MLFKSKCPNWMNPRDFQFIAQVTRHHSEPDETYATFVLHKWFEIERILTDQLGWEFMCGEELKAAQLLYNHRDGMLPVCQEGQGAKPLREAIANFDAILANFDRQGEIPNHFVERLPLPMRIEVRQLVSSMSGSRLRASIADYRTEHEKLLTEQVSRTNQRAYRVALALRSIFEHYSKYPITVFPEKTESPNYKYPEYKVTSSRNHGQPSGAFMKVLEKVFEVVEIEATLHHYADLAKKTPDNDPILKRNRFLMERNLTDQTRDFFTLTEFGWTKSSTMPDQVSDLYADMYSYKELKRCYRKSMKTNAFMTMLTKS